MKKSFVVLFFFFFKFAWQVFETCVGIQGQVLHNTEKMKSQHAEDPVADWSVQSCNKRIGCQGEHSLRAVSQPHQCQSHPRALCILVLRELQKWNPESKRVKCSKGTFSFWWNAKQHVSSFSLCPEKTTNWSKSRSILFLNNNWTNSRVAYKKKKEE